MKALIWIITGVAVGAIAWSVAPDMRRYLKIQSM